MRVNKQPWDFATPQEENKYLQAEVERLKAQQDGFLRNAKRDEAEVERLREALQEIVSLWFRYPPLILPEGFPRVGEIARRALESK